MSETSSPSLPTTPGQANRQMLTLAGPIVLANLSVPLPGMVDTAVMGHLPDASGLAAVGLGAVIFSTLYFSFGFLRMSTLALTAQAVGAEDTDAQGAVLYRSILLGLGFSAIMLISHSWIGLGAFSLIEATQQVEQLGLTYFDIRIWGAPAALINFALVGWLFGLGDMRWPVALQITTNLVNVVLDIVFVFGFGWGIEGVAAATVIAEYSGLLLGFYLVFRLSGQGKAPIPRAARLLDPTALKRLFSVNRDILIRTFCLLITFAHFKVQGAEFGTETLAANIVLLIFLDLSAYGLDAFANAAEIMVGKAVGAQKPAAFNVAVKLAHLWSAGAAVVSSALFVILGPWIVAVFTDQPSVQMVASTYLLWAAILPVTSFWAFVLDGIFIGATRSADLRNAMILSVILYFAAFALFVPLFDNHGLWAALNVYMLARGATLAMFLPGLRRAVATPS